MITREDIRELSEFEAPEGTAVSFYFQPGTPQDRSHRAEAILIKDLVREAMHSASQAGRNGGARADLDRILAMADRLRNNHARAKAVYACAAHGFWREFDLPSRLSRSEIFVDSRFRLKPLAAVLEALPRCCVALVDRESARIFDLWTGAMTEQETIHHELPRRGRSDGWGGYDAGHAERHVDHEAMHHFKKVADRLLALQNAGGFERLLLGCRDDAWPQFEPHLHSYLKQRLVGRFPVDPPTATPEQVRENAQRLLAQWEQSRHEEVVRQVLGEAQREGNGKVGLRNVLAALESGEVQALLLAASFSAPAVQCGNCGHLDTRMAPNCAVCGNPSRELPDVADALLAQAVRNGVEIFYLEDSPELEQAGGVGALLRFRSDQNTSEKLAG